MDVPDTDLDSLGDAVINNEHTEPSCSKNIAPYVNTVKRKKSLVSNVVKLLTPKFEIFRPKSASNTKENTKTTTHCTSPVLLNTMDPGFRLAYFDNVTGSKASEFKKTHRFHQFNESIKKYMDNSQNDIGSYELIITNLPRGLKKKDVFYLCGPIEPEEIEIKTTSNINILYANVRTKNQEDFNQLVEVLEHKQINDTKISIIPITKIIRPLYE